MILCGVGKMSNPTTTEDGLMHFWFGHFMDGMRKTCLVNQDMCGMVLLLGGEMISMPMSVLLRALVTVSRG